MLGTLLSWIVIHLLSTHTATTSLFLDKALCACTLKKNVDCNCNQTNYPPAKQ